MYYTARTVNILCNLIILYKYLQIIYINNFYLIQITKIHAEIILIFT